jgi:serine/threonine protein kinase
VFRRSKRDKSERSGGSFAGRYRLEDTLGEGAMGVVYAAYDDHLRRPVAIKMIRGEGDEALRKRLLREARVAAGVSHPNVCQVFEVGEDGGEIYLVLEMLTGESLAARLGKGTVPLGEALDITSGILAALAALHARDIVHRDLKPSNVFLTPHGVKLLDFGLATPPAGGEMDLRLTRTGAVMGTPRYMAPEQWTGSEVTPATDLFALGAILFEMLSGRPAFDGSSMAEVLNAVVHGEPPVLAGGPEVRSVDALLQRAMAKRPQDRFAGASAMADAVHRTRKMVESGQITPVRTLTRLLVLPFRLLRPDPEIEFLSFGLADAITVSLSGLDSLVVRSSAAATQFVGAESDLTRIAREAGVDAVLLGTLLRAGDQVRATAQLVEAPGGTVLSSQTAQVPTGDIFQLQDGLVREILRALSVTLSRNEDQKLRRDTPANSRAYELYLRANQLGASRRLLPEAREYYKASLAEDPQFAPAWARLGRVHRVIAKYDQDGRRAENLQLAREAFDRALSLDPDLSLAHNLYTYFQVEEMGCARQCMVRLLERARAHGADPEIYSGLVLACRFSGLLEASVAADLRARRLDPMIQTSVQYTYFFLGDYERAMIYDNEEARSIHHTSLYRLGREAEALGWLRDASDINIPGLDNTFMVATLEALGGNPERCFAAFQGLESRGFRDPEGVYFMLLLLAKGGMDDFVLSRLPAVVSGGFTIPQSLRSDPWLETVRRRPEFAAILERAEAGYREAVEAYERAGGEGVLGVPGRPRDPLDATVRSAVGAPPPGA